MSSFPAGAAPGIPPISRGAEPGYRKSGAANRCIGFRPGEGRPEKWGDLIDHVQELGKRLRQAGAFVNCLTAQNVKDEQAKLLRGRLTQLGASFGAAMTQLERKILDTPEEQSAGADQPPAASAGRLFPGGAPSAGRRAAAAGTGGPGGRSGGGRVSRLVGAVQYRRQD